MLAVPVNSFRFQYHNFGATPATTPGTSIIPGASDVEGDWTEIAGDANITQDILYIILWVHSGATAAQDKSHLLDVGWDVAGGTDYVEKISNIICGQSTSPAPSNGIYIHFPCYIPAGSSIAVRVQGANATAETVFVVARFFGQPTRTEAWRTAQHFETIGTITNSQGVSFTPGNSGADGTWVSLGTTIRSLWWWQLCIQCSNNSVSSLAYQFDLAYGDSSNKHFVVQNLYARLTTSEQIGWNHLMVSSICEVPAGAELWVRGTCSGTASTGWNAVAIGAGG